MVIKSTKNFARCMSGSLASIVAIVSPLLFGAAGMAVDYARFTHTKANLQSLADSSAVAAASSLAVANTSGATAEAVAKSHVHQSAVDAAWQKGSDGISVATNVDTTTSKVKITLSQEC